jgi:SNF2 family DNA or RNA helicase
MFLGWIDGDKPSPELLGHLEAKGLTPADAGFYTSARETVIDMGIVRRRKIDVAKDLPAKRVVDLPVELDDELGASIRAAEAELAKRLLDRYNRMAINGSFRGSTQMRQCCC